MLQRMSEIAVQAASDSNDDAVDRPSLDAEFQQLIKEIDQIADTTTFNDMNLLDGSFTNKFVQVGSNKGVELEISIDSMSAGALGLAVKTGDDMATLAGVTGSTITDGAAGTKASFTLNAAGATLDKESSVTMTVGSGADAVKLTVAVADGDKDGTISKQEIADAFNGKEIKFGGKTFQAVTASTTVTFTASENGALAAGAASATVTVAADNGAAVGVKNREDALNAIDSVKAAIRTVSDQRAALGAVQNRLEHKISNLDNTVENVSAAESRIRDVDIAKEMTNFTKNNILSQAATAMLAQANAAPQGVLSLLQ